jgi:regulator of replication initiation timing
MLRPDTDLSDTDDLDSIASGSTSINTFGARKSIVRFVGHHREVERLKEKVSKLERENRGLRQKVEELENILGHNDEDQKNEEEKKTEEELAKTLELTEGGVWNLRKLDSEKPQVEEKSF